MNQAFDAVLDKARVREVTGIFHARPALDAAVSDLLLAGFDRADIDVVASVDEVYRRLGGAYVAPEELPDVPQAPRQPFIGREDVSVTMVAVTGSLAFVGAGAAAFGVVALGGTTGETFAAAAIAGIAAGAIGAVLMGRVFGRERAQGLDAFMAERGLVLWVRVRSPEREMDAREIMRRHGADAIRVHEIEIEKRLDDLPLASLQPDPWLGGDHLGRS
jgi:hypothetical protein